MPTTSQKAGQPLRKAEVAARLLASLDGRIEPVRASFPYRVRLLLVAVTLLVLPLVYLAMIGAVAYGIYWHVVNDAPIVGTANVRAGLVVYLAPTFMGLILLFFMIKPLFARRRRNFIPVNLRREEEPVLFEFVDRRWARRRRLGSTCRWT